MKYSLRAQVRRTVVDTIRLNVDANNLDEAKGLAFLALEQYPKPHEHPEVGFIYVENRDTLETNILRVDKDEIDETD